MTEPVLFTDQQPDVTARSPRNATGPPWEPNRWLRVKGWMRDDLLARVDRTIRESRLVRDQARETLAKARIAGANARAT